MNSTGLRLGFGCGSLYGGRGRAGSLRVLEAALDAGITWFDTARMYGFGDAEGLLGRLVPRHRGRLTLVTKAGILPAGNALHRRARAKAVRLLRKLPGLESRLSAPPPPLPVFNMFGVGQLRNSVETSLRALRTDHVDLLLLHECRPQDALAPTVLEMLEALRAEGKILAYGTATSVDATLSILASGPTGCAALQFASSPWRDNVARVRARTSLPLITHSTLGAPFLVFLKAVKETPKLRTLSKSLDLDPDDASGFARLMLALALRANPDGMVLFSTSQVGRVRHNLSAADACPAELDAAARLIAAASA